MRAHSLLGAAALRETPTSTTDETTKASAMEFGGYTLDLLRMSCPCERLYNSVAPFERQTEQTTTGSRQRNMSKGRVMPSAFLRAYLLVQSL